MLTQIHDYDLAWWLFGAPARVIASGGHLSDLEIDVEDTVDARLLGGRADVRIRQTFDIRGIAAGSSRWRRREEALELDRSDVPGYERNEMFLDEVRHFVAW